MNEKSSIPSGTSTIEALTTWFGRIATELNALCRLMAMRNQIDGFIVFVLGSGILNAIEFAQRRGVKQVVAVERHEHLARLLRRALQKDGCICLSDLQYWCRNRSTEDNTELSAPYIEAGLHRLTDAGMLPTGWTLETCISTAGFKVPRSVAKRVTLAEEDAAQFMANGDSLAHLVVVANLTSQMLKLKEGRSTTDMVVFYRNIARRLDPRGYALFQIGFGQFYDQMKFVGRDDEHWPSFMTQLVEAQLQPQIVVLADAVCSSRGGSKVIRGNYDVIAGVQPIPVNFENWAEEFKTNWGRACVMPYSPISNWEQHHEQLAKDDLVVIAMVRRENTWCQFLIKRERLEEILTSEEYRDRLLFRRNLRPAGDLLSTIEVVQEPALRLPGP